MIVVDPKPYETACRWLSIFKPTFWCLYLKLNCSCYLYIYIELWHKTQTYKCAGYFPFAQNFSAPVYHVRPCSSQSKVTLRTIAPTDLPRNCAGQLRVPGGQSVTEAPMQIGGAGQQERLCRAQRMANIQFTTDIMAEWDGQRSRSAQQTVSFHEWWVVRWTQTLEWLLNSTGTVLQSRMFCLLFGKAIFRNKLDLYIVFLYKIHG